MENFTSKEDEWNTVQNKSSKELEEELGLYFLSLNKLGGYSTSLEEEEHL